MDEVNAGAEWLNHHAPDWWTKIDTDAINIDDAQYCVLGQAFAAEADQGGFLSGYHFVNYIWDFSGVWEIEHGFLARSNEHRLALNEAWAEKISEMEFTK